MIPCTSPCPHTLKGGKRSPCRFWSKYHPRTRGEKENGNALPLKCVGSPPHTRGKVSRVISERNPIRITPAHAGKRDHLTNCKTLCKDHPRTRGEKFKTTLLAETVGGSPPHTRGKVPGVEANTLGQRITPAHAGKSSARLISQMGLKDHPRTRGEKPYQPSAPAGAQGSPPHTRGKGLLKTAISQIVRITPAHAGKSIINSEGSDTVTDHPRTRGEKRATAGTIILTRGSPPHTRGKVNPPQDFIYYLGITPAHAGKSSQSDEQNLNQYGSPPHTRGKDNRDFKSFEKPGITPAHAGKRLNKPPYYGHSSAAGHRISFNFPMSSYVSRQSVKALCAPRISIPKYSQSAVSVY